MPVADTAALYPGDTISLPMGGRAQVLLADGLHEIRGAQKLQVNKRGIDQAAVLRRAGAGPGAGTLANATRSALFAAPSQLPNLGLLITTRQAANGPCYSPAGSTRHLMPLLVWRNEPGKSYDVLITDELNPTAPAWALAKATSPIDFSKIPDWRGRSLAKNGLYRLRLSQTDNPLATTEITFRTLADATPPENSLTPAPADKLARAWQALASDPPCLGDALGELLTLPPVQSHSELGLKLQLVAFGQLGAKNDYEDVLAKLAQGSNPKANR